MNEKADRTKFTFAKEYVRILVVALWVLIRLDSCLAIRAADLLITVFANFDCSTCCGSLPCLQAGLQSLLACLACEFLILSNVLQLFLLRLTYFLPIVMSRYSSARRRQLIRRLLSSARRPRPTTAQRHLTLLNRVLVRLAQMTPNLGLLLHFRLG